jgi:hypothetical protein
MLNILNHVFDVQISRTEYLGNTGLRLSLQYISILHRKRKKGFIAKWYFNI